MILRRLTDAGIERLGKFLDSQTTEEPEPLPDEILTDETMSEPVQPEIEIEQLNFSNRFEAAKYLNEKLAEAGIANLERDKGLWAWLSLFYFEQLCPPDQNGLRKPGERARWIVATGDYRKYYRHLLAGPFRIYRAHRDNPDRAFALLCTSLNRPGDVVEQLASRQELVTNSAVMEAATTLYVDDETEKPKRGAAGRGPGSARRLADVLNQFDVTWDLYSMATQDLLDMLPVEFERFRS
jgi:hypothetical protein